ncbi:Aldehyde Dehydrogenase [Pseudopedobacter saltans DSM 12145]|uniref:Aldehyde Dehydrogenase n=1 Tax=Pseudopedobacter saltans (strain ATCC 51119 / DSM 12145 / JCM 21818 / CCUG 39354 / LMG 10337 / NBRC 100064 / NCIMB 13643) TaxID=762903 RepID=F0S961_PSESL|nr:NAD-dependent succinate-semialdehyde dehydrogenase [Pseudopedobacter saltans]ADY51359.1 Aldehyde Dehydrogenase [Pseudopedobacter saltans DSM 12145]
MSLKSINPYTGKLIRSYPEYTQKKIDAIINATHQDWQKLKLTSFKERSVWMNNIAKALITEKEALGKLMVDEIGKPVKDAIAEIEKCASVCEYYATHAEGFLEDELIETEAQKSYVSFQPIGIVLAIMPWNFPFWQVFRFVAPALMAGNAGILKHASNTSACALAIERIVKQSGFPENSFNAIIISSSKLEETIKNPLIKAVTLTGSTGAGKKVAALAGGLIKKTVLELGGSDPYIVLKDADLQMAAETCVNSRLINNGQSCIAAKRFIVEQSVAKEFIKLFKAKMEAKKFGDPADTNFHLGTMARTDLRDDLHKQVLSAINQGAKCILGGYLPEGKAAFYPPTILTNVKKGNIAYNEEIFGPVAAIIIAKNEDDAIAIANDTSFGLGGAIFTKNIKKGETIARERLQAGSCFVNSFVKSDPRLPFGGINESGYGRELSLYGIKEFVNIKTVYIK